MIILHYFDDYMHLYKLFTNFLKTNLLSGYIIPNNHLIESYMQVTYFTCIDYIKASNLTNE